MRQEVIPIFAQSYISNTKSEFTLDKDVDIDWTVLAPPWIKGLSVLHDHIKSCPTLFSIK